MRKEKAQHEKQLKAMEEACKTCEESQLNTVKKEKEDLENGSAELQKQVQTLKEDKKMCKKD
ncbi:hypothetical protein [Wolbachia endosymbiont of Wuchereria bancrofti]|uniref:hypothetical protein n=1 Tax=Wolbachia endosymbiont of Wuchereria bancrofti TaxID=96496 RepID=UPI000B4DAA15|nr:hypothetical protein [Wolbachia endosymbiont of Wuchereria bancrofti]OWZ25643.1 hypothetical protein CCY16_00486 [Wolbachia endosymbiont of Wuchereria bancrofti]